MENKTIRERLAALRARMRAYGVDAYLIPSSDYHNSEYAAEFFQSRAYFSGFTGSNGTLVVEADRAGLWTDGRYFVQAERELSGTGVTLYRMLEEGVPTIPEYLKERLGESGCLGFDGRVVSAEYGRELERALGIRREEADGRMQRRLRSDLDLAGEVWKARPPLPCRAVYRLSDALCGERFAGKLHRVRERLREEGAARLFLSRLDDIMWLTNLRGSDIACNPVALSYLMVTEDACVLFLQPAALDTKEGLPASKEPAITADVRAYAAANGITLRDYAEIIPYLQGCDWSGKTLYDRENVSYALCRMIEDGARRVGGTVRSVMNPTTKLKAVKNETELERLREAYLRDSVVLTKFIYWVKKNAGRIPFTEYEAALRLDGMRAALPGFLMLSFPTISAYGANAAVVHYEASKEDAAAVEAAGMLLVDSGATYLGGTTDVTRTIVLGPLSAEVRKHYTLVTAGMLRLSAARFPEGCHGYNLDILARGPLWDAGLDYKHGTGHGIGYMLNVHEGPQGIRWRAAKTDAPLSPGMIVSDEPGVYIEGSHGIRIENILEVVRAEKNESGQFLAFRHLTYVPIDREGIEADLLQPADVAALNRYHQTVYERLAPHIREEGIRDWLKDACAPLSSKTF